MGTSQLYDWMMQAYREQPDEFAGSVSSFLSQCCAEGLLNQTKNDVPQASKGAPALPEPGSSPLPYSPPELEKHEDLEAMLLADPIHEFADPGE